MEFVGEIASPQAQFNPPGHSTIIGEAFCLIILSTKLTRRSLGHKEYPASFVFEFAFST